MLDGLPDLAAPLPSTSGRVFRAFGTAGLAVAVPDRLVLQRRVDGSPVLLLTVLRGPAGTGGRFELGVTLDADLDGVGRDLLGLAEPLRVATADPEDGVLEVSGPFGTVAAYLGPELLLGARVDTALTAEGALLTATAIEDRGLGVDAVMRLAVRAVAPRLPLVAVIDPRQVAELLAQRFGPGAAVDAADLTAALDSLWTDPATTVEGDRAAVDARVRAETLALRLRDRLTVPEPVAASRHLLRPVADVPTGPERVDLAAPTAVLVHLRATLDGIATRQALADAHPSRLVRRVELPTLPPGHVRLTLAANLPEPVAAGSR